MLRWVCLILLLGAATAGAEQQSRHRDAAEEQVEFGIEVAKHGLWQEAAYRFRKATHLDPSYAEAFNNLGVAFEQIGNLDEARVMYEQALALDPDDSYIRDNYERFREIDDRRVRPIPQVAQATGS
jgi:Flp pilus assembly protein TadD